ncbi:MAG: hypothetical protein NVSMB57_04290 [Actinomycetota bacterium]
MWLHVAGIPIFALSRGYTIRHAVFEAAIVAAPAVAASSWALHRRVRTFAASIGLLSASAVLVHLSGGVIEMHFHFFVMVAVVALYQDWLPFLAAIAYVLIHHGVMGTLDPRSVYNHPAAWAHPWVWAGIHAGFIVSLSAASLVSWGLNERALTRQRSSEDRLREETEVVEALHSVAQTLAGELDLKRTIQAVTDASTQLSGAKFGAFFYTQESASGELLTLYALSGAPEEAFSKFPLPRNTEIFAPTFSGTQVMRLDDVHEDPRYGHNSPYKGMPPGHLPVRSYLAVPVKRRTGEVLGGLFFGHPEPARFTEAHERIVLGIAGQAAIAMENARLYESERDSFRESEEARKRLTLLADVGTVLASSLDIAELLRDTAGMIATTIADYCAIDIVLPNGNLERIVCEARPEFSEVAVQMKSQHPTMSNLSHPSVQAIRSGRSQVIRNVTETILSESVLDETARNTVLRNSPATIVSIPMPGRSGMVGSLVVCVFKSSDRTIEDEDVKVIEEVARRVSVAVENARLYAHQRSVSEALQHSLLPERLPEVPGLETAARYIPGGPGEQIGGDWYDVFRLPRGLSAFAMGDVVGHGVRAAALMGQLRNGARAYAIHGMPPQEVVQLLNQMLFDLGTECMATMIYGIFDPDDGTLRFVNAGHPPPLVLHEQQASFLESKAGVPLGAIPRAQYSETVTRLDPQATLLLYTDGLVEERSEGIDDGLKRLQQAAAGISLPIEDLCNHLLSAMLRDLAPSDDTAILAMRLIPLGARLNIHVQRDPSMVAPLRQTVRRWLVAAGATEDETDEIILALGEACANAVQHAGGSPSSTYKVEGVINGRVQITVHDRGTWRETRASGGGRGLGIMERFMDSVDIQTGDSGTIVVMERRLDALTAKEPAQ